ncbi:MAG: glycosyltransferase family 1 protein [Psychromonas sp.]|nr:glycosyltransferase family 1 protein [Alteromonadales bacterium]MCP5079817.1 glycosyltransferase family 1 protein [Psychromonas sp.]
MSHDLIVFAEDWGALPSSTQHLIKQLAKTRKVVWINSIGLRQPTLSLRDVKRLWDKLTASKVQQCGNLQTSDEQLTATNSDFYIVNPRTIPAPRSLFARYIAQKLLLLQLKPVLKKAKLNSPILWTSLPTAVDFSGSFNEVALVYYCGDDFSGLAGVDHKTVAERENELVAKADLILAASNKLVSNFPAENTQLLTHGVDYTLFSTTSKRATDLPNDGKPIAGFYGSISAWLDIKLLHDTIVKMPHWHFVFIGKAVVDLSALTVLDNVIFLGERPHQQLPSYSQHWTASLLPFVNNAQIQACNPLKLKEYLAAGTPIISTYFAAIKPYRGLVQIADSSEAMVEALTASEQLHTIKQFPDALRSKVKAKSWSARAQQVSNWLEQL